MTKPLILLGSGGHAKVLIALLQRLNYPLLGFVDPHRPIGANLSGLTNLGADNVVFNYPSDEIMLVNGIGMLPYDKGLRLSLFNTFSAQGYQFKTLQDPTALVAVDVAIKAGVQVMAGVIIQAGTEIAENCIINSGAIIEHDCRIGQSVHIAPGAVVCGGVEVGDYVHVGAGATLIQGIKIGSGSIIGAGSVVTHDVACRQIVYPARSLCQAINRACE
jgi:UDP-perosamine 4-acetyltransferase